MWDIFPDNVFDLVCDTKKDTVIRLMITSFMRFVLVSLLVGRSVGL